MEQERYCVYICSTNHGTCIANHVNEIADINYLKKPCALCALSLSSSYYNYQNIPSSHTHNLKSFDLVIGPLQRNSIVSIGVGNHAHASLLCSFHTCFTIFNYGALFGHDL